MQIDPLPHHRAFKIQKLEPLVLVNGTDHEDVRAGGRTHSEIHSEVDSQMAFQWGVRVDVVVVVVVIPSSLSSI